MHIDKLVELGEAAGRRETRSGPVTHDACRERRPLSKGRRRVQRVRDGCRGVHAETRETRRATGGGGGWEGRRRGDRWSGDAIGVDAVGAPSGPRAPTSARATLSDAPLAPSRASRGTSLARAGGGGSRGELLTQKCVSVLAAGSRREGGGLPTPLYVIWRSRRRKRRAPYR